MRVLVLFAHPLESSFSAALHARAIEALGRAGHEVDDCNLYAEGFDPVLSRAERLVYRDTERNQEQVRAYVERLRAAEGLLLVFPVWNYGFPAILHGFIDRVFLPGVSFRLVNGEVRPALTRIRHLAAVTTYGGSRLRAWLTGDPPRRLVTRALRAMTGFSARTSYLALYGMDRSDEAERRRFLDRVGRRLEGF